MVNKSICIVSTYPPQRCGIATYTAELALAMVDHGVKSIVLTESGAADGTVNNITSLPTWNRCEDWVNNIVSAIHKMNLRVVHVQYTPDTLGWDNRLPRLLDRLSQDGVGTVITLHTVHTLTSGLLEGRFSAPSHHRKLAQHAHAIVVHGNATQAKELLRQGISAEKIFVIPHGTKVFNPPGQSESRARLGLSNRGPLLLYFGFIHALKNLHTIIRSMKFLSKQFPGIFLLVAGSIQNRGWYNLLYLRHCRQMIKRLKLERHIGLREEFVPDDLVPSLYGASDLVLLPYSQHYGSASGVLHNALGAGKLMLCSKSPKFAEITEHISPDLQVTTHDPKAWANRIAHLLLHQNRQETLLKRIRAYAEETSWPRIAARHLELYEKLQPVKIKA